MTRDVRAGKPQRRSGGKASDVLGRGPVAPGSPLPADDRDLALPHERDTSTGTASTGQQGQDAAGMRQRELMKRAADDLAEGQVDTDLRASPGLDAQTRERLLREHGATRSAAPAGQQAGHQAGHQVEHQAGHPGEPRAGRSAPAPCPVRRPRKP